MFGPLKQAWSDEQQRFFGSKRQRVTKENFVSIYGRAHQKTLTPELIRSAFRVTGVWPFDPSRITKKTMASSLETSSQGCLPLPQPSPVRALSSAIRLYQRTTPTNLPCTPGPSSQLPIDSDDPFITAQPSFNHQPATIQSGVRPSWNIAVDNVMDSLASTSASFLADNTPLTSSHRVPEYTPSLISPTRKRTHELLGESPQNAKEQAYQHALQGSYEDSYHREGRYKTALLGMQSSAILHVMYCDRLTEQLAAQEERQKKKRKGQLNGDGLPKLLTGDEFYTRVVEHEKAIEQDKADRENRQKQREAQPQLMASWKKADEARKERNNVQKEAYHEALRLWEAERDLAKFENRRSGWKKPTRGELEKAEKKPKKSGVSSNDHCEKEGDNGAPDDSASDGGSEEE